MDCAHFSKEHFNPISVEHALKSLPESERFCSNCKAETDTRWTCLQCGTISCGRFEKGHALKHYKETGHVVALDLVTKACHCYECDEYIVAGNLEADLDKLRKTVTDIISGIDDLEDNNTKARRIVKYNHITGLDNLGIHC